MIRIQDPPGARPISGSVLTGIYVKRPRNLVSNSPGTVSNGTGIFVKRTRNLVPNSPGIFVKRTETVSNWRRIRVKIPICHQFPGQSDTEMGQAPPVPRIRATSQPATFVFKSKLVQYSFIHFKARECRWSFVMKPSKPSRRQGIPAVDDGRCLLLHRGVTNHTQCYIISTNLITSCMVAAYYTIAIWLLWTLPSVVKMEINKDMGKRPVLYFKKDENSQFENNWFLSKSVFCNNNDCKIYGFLIMWSKMKTRHSTGRIQRYRFLVRWPKPVKDRICFKGTTWNLQSKYT